MSDNLTKRARSALMARIRGDNLKPESALAAALAARSGLSFSRNCRGLPGTPDFIVWAAGVEKKVAVFVDGCFWHGCPEHFKLPKTWRAFWSDHIAKNMARDRRQRAALRRAGYSVLTVWEHEVKRSAAGRVAKKLVDNANASR